MVLLVTPEIHLLAGLNGAGKTIHARHLVATLPAVRFSLDEWMLQLYDLSFDDELYPSRAEKCRAFAISVVCSSRRRNLVVDSAVTSENQFTAQLPTKRVASDCLIVDPPGACWSSSRPTSRPGIFPVVWSSGTSHHEKRRVARYERKSVSTYCRAGSWPSIGYRAVASRPK